MVLKEDHISTFQINWEDKITNLKRITQDLNISLDSLVFIDDSEFEINLVRMALPEVEVIHIPKSKVVESKDILASCGLFDTLALSEEDKKRGSLYKTEIKRKELLAQSIDMKTYFKSLEMKLDICFADEFAIPRIAQLTQKTNQFNLTTKRYSEADIKSFADSKSSDVIYVGLNDRFGDSGIVGICILRYKDDKAFIDTFLLSCRVLGRGVEDAFLSNVLKLAKIRGREEVVGEYYATRKNSQVSGFYSKRGFDNVKTTSSKAEGIFCYDMGKKIKNEADYFMEINSEIDK
jgi:FkbH-like protein